MSPSDNEGNAGTSGEREPKWRQYELEIESVLAAVDPGAEVSNSVVVRGRLSGAPRQVDVLIKGTVAGIPINIAVECKRNKRSVGIQKIDEFVGKLLDLGVERGIVYSFSGFTPHAAARAQAASNPSVMTVFFDEPPEDFLERYMVFSAPGYPEYIPPLWAATTTVADYRYFLEAGDWPL